MPDTITKQPASTGRMHPDDARMLGHTIGEALWRMAHPPQLGQPAMPGRNYAAPLLQSAQPVPVPPQPAMPPQPVGPPPQAAGPPMNILPPGAGYR